MPKLTHRLLLLTGSALVFAAAATAQRTPTYGGAEEARRELATAIAEQRAAETRSQRLEAEADDAQGSAERAARQTAALAARIQQAEAGIAAAIARTTIIDQDRTDLREELGREQRPLVRLTAALQQFSRRPVALSMLKPGDVRDIVYLRAILDTAVPQVMAGTEGLRGQIARATELRREAEAAAQVLRVEERALVERRSQLAEVETRERLAARQATGEAGREAERALALAEEARDLDGLVDELDRAAQLRRQLAALPGPRLRPATPETAEVSPPAPDASPTAVRGAPSPFILPVSGRTISGFGAPDESGLSKGLTLAPIAGAQVVAPASGRIAFAGPYRGYGRIVIVEHAGGWTSLITGLARTDARVGQDVVGGAPLGIAGPGRPQITLELRRNGEAVNPARYTD